MFASILLTEAAGERMQRITISIDEALAQTFDRLLEARGYQSRSEGVRDLVREAVETWDADDDHAAPCVASLAFVYSPKVRALAQRLSEICLENHDLVASKTEAPLDHDHAFTVLSLRGVAAKVRHLADQIRAERGVRLAHLNLVRLTPGDPHAQAGAHSHDGHRHLTPRVG